MTNSSRYPIYVISKGRWQQRTTVRALERMNITYRIVVEPQEFEHYAEVIGRDNIITTPFSNLGQGSIPVRNFVWEHAISSGSERHWILDDNIEGFTRLNRNEKIRVSGPAIFRAAEDFVDRYENVALAGFNYRIFAPARSGSISPYTLNTRIYSCILIKNDLPYRWRGRYNEDTDLSIRALKDGWCTVLFNAFLCDKQGTMTAKGGNSDDLYGCSDWNARFEKVNEHRLEMARSLVRQHPDVATVTWKWGRWQHHVDYSPFRHNRLVKRNNVVTPEGVNNYGMILTTASAGRCEHGYFRSSCTLCDPEPGDVHYQEWSETAGGLR